MTEQELIQVSTILRKKSGLSQRRFADRIGMKQQQLARIELGKHKITLDTYVKIIKQLGYEVVVVSKEELEIAREEDAQEMAKIEAENQERKIREQREKLELQRKMEHGIPYYGPNGEILYKEI